VKSNRPDAMDTLGFREGYAGPAMKDRQPILGARLRRIRAQKGLTQREVASPRYTHAYISTIEAGRRQPSAAALQHFATKLGVDVEDIVTGRPPGLLDQLEESLAQARIAASDGSFEQAESFLSVVQRRAHRYGAQRAEADAHVIRGIILERSGRPDAALEEYETAEQLLADEPPAARADAVAGKARSLQALGDIRYSIFVLESLQRLIPPTDAEAAARAHVVSVLLDAYLDTGLVRAAEEAGRVLEKLRPLVRDHVREGQIHLYLARLRASEGRIRDADRLLVAAAAAYEASGLRTEIGYAHLARGYLLSRAGKLTEAAKELELARAIFAETRNERELNNTLIELARVARVRGDNDESASLLRNAIDSLKGGDPQLLAWAHREYALLFVERDPAVSEKHLRQALDLFDRGDEHVETAATYRMLGDLLRANGDRDAAFEAYAAGIHRLPASS
jgi:tetratricopeptide (TPR) repeat protein